MKPEHARAGVAAISLVAGLVRGKTLKEAQEETREVLRFADPAIDGLAPVFERFARRAAASAAAKKPMCSVSGCVLPPGHPTAVHGWHQDCHGTLFQVEGTEPC